jgi:hypothetical protein
LAPKSHSPRIRATGSKITAIQAIRSITRPIGGVSAHPESSTV